MRVATFARLVKNVAQRSNALKAVKTTPTATVNDQDDGVDESDESDGQILPVNSIKQQMESMEKAAIQEEAKGLALAAPKRQAEKIPEGEILPRRFITEHLHKSGVCTRGQAFDLLRQGFIEVNGVRLRRDMQIRPGLDEVRMVRTKTSPFNLPLSANTKIWTVFKPKGCTTKGKDPLNRPNIFGLARALGIVPPNVPLRSLVLESFDH